MVIDLALGERQDGMGLATAVQAGGAIPIVFVTGPAEEEETVQASRTIEGTARLLRPFTAEDLSQAIDRACLRVQDGLTPDT